MNTTKSQIIHFSPLLVSVIVEIDKINRCFLWGHDTETRKLHSFSWKNATLPLYSGGLAIRDLQVFNYAMLGKRACQLLMTNEQEEKRYPAGAYTWRKSTFPKNIFLRQWPNHIILKLGKAWFFVSFVEAKLTLGSQKETSYLHLANLVAARWP